eukprot:scaffold1097_cov246-Pinguiococcus_pyrenoidosus.AAC.11
MLEDAVSVERSPELRQALPVTPTTTPAAQGSQPTDARRFRWGGGAATGNFLRQLYAVLPGLAHPPRTPRHLRLLGWQTRLSRDLRRSPEAPSSRERSLPSPHALRHCLPSKSLHPHPPRFLPRCERRRQPERALRTSTSPKPRCLAGPVAGAHWLPLLRLRTA